MNHTYEAMEENQSSNWDGCTTTSSPGKHDDILRQHTSHFGTVIPNRIFVGGLDYKINEWDLRHVFSQHGALKEVKVVSDRSGVSKRYGFVTFENEDDALKVLNDVKEIFVKDTKLYIGLAVRKQQASLHTNTASVARPRSAKPPMSGARRHQTTPTGYPCMYHNGVAYFPCPTVGPPHQQWPQLAPPPLLPQYPHPVYQPPSYYPQYQYVPEPYPWNAVQPLLPSGPVVYPQPSEYLYQPADGGSVPPPLPVMEDASLENWTSPHSHVHLRPRNR